MTDSIDQIRARFQPRTKNRSEVKLFTIEMGFIWGAAYCAWSREWIPMRWFMSGRTNSDNRLKNSFDLIPRSRHEDLIAEARQYLGYAPTNASLLVRLIEALEQASPETR